MLWPPSSQSSVPAGSVGDRGEVAAGEALQARRPVDAAQARLDGRDPDVAEARRAQRRDGGAGIGELVAAR